MRGVIGHLETHWHHHLAVWGTALAVLCLVVGTVTGYEAGLRFGGGFRPGPMPPPISISGGPLPAHYSLTRYIVRVHNQGSSSSCVGQTLSALMEIATREHRGSSKKWYWFSAGYLWNQLNGGVDTGTTYDAAFNVLITQGDARVSTFAPDGWSDYFAQPGPGARADARKHRATSWRAILPGDRYTIEYEVSHGRPVAIAIPVQSSTYWHFGNPNPITSQSGPFLFWHSVTIVGYGRIGVTVLNSWGPGYGRNGLVTLSWGFIQAVGAYVAVWSPYFPPAKRPAPRPAKKPVSHGRPRNLPVPSGRRHRGVHHAAA